MMESKSRERGIVIRQANLQWYQRYEFLAVMALLLIAYGAFLLPDAGKPTLLQWAIIGTFCLCCFGWVVNVTIDPEKPGWLSGVGALVLVAILGWLFYRYSGAKWYLLNRMFFNRELIGEAWPILLTGLGKTISLFLVSALLSIGIGLVMAIIRSFDNVILNAFIVVYIDFFRSIPLLVLVIVIYYALPFLGIELEAYAAGVATLSLSASAFVTEYFRSGIESVHQGQVEAARSLGFNVMQTMRLVILPQAIRVVIPPLTGQMVGLIKATAIVSVVGLQELLKRALEIMEWKTNPTPLVSVTVIYLLILLPLARFSSLLETRMKRWVKKTS
jgi:polar amino acid transport system permease protein